MQLLYSSASYYEDLHDLKPHTLASELAEELMFGTLSSDSYWILRMPICYKSSIAALIKKNVYRYTTVLFVIALLAMYESDMYKIFT